LRADLPVLVIGAAGVDIVGQLKGEIDLQTSCPANIRMSFGGQARNVAENLARLGQPVTLITVVGNDQAGEQLLVQAASAGIDTHPVIRTSEHPTGAYLAVVTADGELRFGLDDMRAISVLTPTYLHENEALFKQASLLFVDTNLSKDTMRTAVTLARRAKLPICADATSINLAEKLAKYLPDLSMITLNSAEATVLLGQPRQPANRRWALEAAKSLVSRGVEIAIVTLSKSGVCYATSQTSGHISAIRTKVIDPTGAGAAMTAGVLFALLNEIPLDDAIRLGVCAASLTLGHPGAVMSDLSLEKLYDQLGI
jgi:pseudouridine kinase